MNTTYRVGFIGIGLMGTPMAHRLLDAGHSVRIWGRSPHKLESLYAAGAQRAESPASLASNVDVLFLCVSNTEAVEDVVFGSDGAVRGATAGAVLVDTSSIDPTRTREMADRLRSDTGMDWVDAPVSGGVPGAEGGTLAIMCGGSEDAFNKALPLLNVLGRPTRMGDVGSGQTTKLVNQLIVGCTMTVVAEATRLATAAGVDVAKIPVALAGGRADSLVLQQYMVRMAEQDQRVEGALSTIVKDMVMVTKQAGDSGVPIPMLDQAHAIHDAVVDMGLGEGDNARVYDYYLKQSTS